MSGEITNTDPAYGRVKGLGVAMPEAEMIPKRCEPLEESKAARVSADLVNEFVEKSRQVLERHEINRRRVADGKLAANIILTRDAGVGLPRLFSIKEKYGVDFVCLA
ncbi:hypothetical protein B6U84_06275, partial [Candidatus Bathyarchaeota archaeon ex4484_40]